MTNSRCRQVRCYHCGYKWIYRGKNKNSARCPNQGCRRYVNLKKADSMEATSAMMEGNMIALLDNKGKSKKFPKDYLLYLLDDDELVLALNKACAKKKKSPEKLIKKIVKEYLEKEGYM